MARLRLSKAREFLIERGLLVSLAVFLGVLGFGLVNGGYFPVSWGWGALGLLALMLGAFVSGEARSPGALGFVMIVSLALLSVWTAASSIWSLDESHTIDEVERSIVYLAAAVAVLALLRAHGEWAVLVGVWAAVSALSGYGLSIWLFPRYLGYEDLGSRYRLSAPLGYWNAFGVLAAMGILLAFGLAARAAGALLRALAAASVVVMAVTLYFTFSRGGWLALAAGLVVTVAIDRRRLQLLTTAFVVAPWAAVGVWVASRSHALTHSPSSIDAISRDGHGVGAFVMLLAAAAAFAVLVLDAVESRVRVPVSVVRVYAVVLGMVVVVGLGAVFERHGSPVTLTRKAYRSFNAAQPRTHGAISSRLFTLSGDGRSEQFHTARQEVEAYPWLGSGAGTFDLYWFQHRRADFNVRDVHNLYLETLAELGPIGLVLLLGVLAVPVLAVVRARGRPLAAAAFGAYVAFLLHAAIDWDWEMPAVTLSALFCGIALLACLSGVGRGRRLPRWARAFGAAGVLTLGGFVVLTLLGNRVLSASSSAKDARQYLSAELDARRAMDLLPWSAEPWRRLGEAQSGLGDYAAARGSFRKAIAKEPNDWTLWFDLAQVSAGRTQRIALVQALKLNPLSPEIKAWKSDRPAG